MASSPPEANSRSSLEFVESSVLEALVPASSEANIEKDLSAWNGTIEDESGSILPFLAQRNVLLLDELLSVLVVFRTRLLEDDTLKSYLARLVVNLEVFAFSTAPPPEAEPKAGPTKELIHSCSIQETDAPIVVRHGKGDNAYSFVIWTVEAKIARPQGRFHKPAVYFQPTASFKPASTPTKTVPDDEYLPSGIPTALNLLQAFDNDPALAGVHPRLSAMRINRIAPSANPVVKEMVRPIRTGQRPLFRMLPALTWRVRYARIQTSLSDLSLLTALDLDVTTYHNFSVVLKSVSVSLYGGTATPFANPQDLTTVHKPGDQLTYLFKIRPDITTDGTPSLGTKGHYLIMHVSASVQLSACCTPNIAIEWKSPVDFTSAIEQTPTMLKAAHRLSNPATQAAKPPNPDALPAHDTQGDEAAATNAINLTLTISGPDKVVVGKEFTWTVFISNRSNKARNLAILVVPKRSHRSSSHSSSTHPARPSTSGSATTRTQHQFTTSSSSSNAKALLAPAVVDENIVYATQKSARIETADLICLTTDIRLGQLSPGSCYTADLRFVALVEGVVGVDGVRVVDLGTGEGVDVREVPRVIAVKGDDGKGGRVEDVEGEEEDEKKDVDEDDEEEEEEDEDDAEEE
ncbi:TRAPP trafficking subunit Trs65-domain-containing protein [Paraphoma chrysanthemicola]|uniref:TRAPP trafficking subunit Trs65-domain-containing protein n=1 Tax=Paraphoma chrysanthemicola TaxID=798071 RepID=A0A8K0RIM8_9PLEO|nr:TRAPP trafficking subunit Trs65-domain-containing protein [Paraphoma chrysanthemicola]